MPLRPSACGAGAAAARRDRAFVTTEQVRIANLACEDVVALGRAPYTNWIGRLREEGPADRAPRALEQVGMGAFARKTMDRMSDGEVPAVMIARAWRRTPR